MRAIATATAPSTKVTMVSTSERNGNEQMNEPDGFRTMVVARDRTGYPWRGVEAI